MSAEPVSPVRPSAIEPPAPSAAGAPGSAGEFGRALEAALGRPYSEIARVRSEIASIRDGSALRPRAAPRVEASPEPVVSPPAVPTSELLALREAAGSPGDPYGWRAMTRSIGEAVVGPGFGWLFERQINQESGFLPEVVYGLRRSSAGAEGIAQLMPEYYPAVNRTDPQQSLFASASTMRHYLEVWDGDVRKALASYNAGLGRVRSLVEAHGEGWERGLPAETRTYLASIIGSPSPVFFPVQGGPGYEAAVFGGRGPGGVLVPPIDGVDAMRRLGTLIEMLTAAGAPVRAPADGHVAALDGSGALTRLMLDHGNGWQTMLDGIARAGVSVGDVVRRSEPLGWLGEGGLLRMGVTLDGRGIDPARYLLPPAGWR